MSTKVYMAVTNDRYELPIAVADQVNELAAMLGKTRISVSQVMLRQRKGVLPKGEIKYVEVMLNDDRRGDYI